MFDINNLKLSTFNIINLELLELYLIKKYNNKTKIKLEIINNNIIIKNEEYKKVGYYKRVIRNLINYKRIIGGVKNEN